MKKILGIVVLSLLLSGNAYTQETALICELKKYFSRKNLVSKQIETPLNQVDAIYISKQYLVLDFDKKDNEYVDIFINFIDNNENIVYAKKGSIISNNNQHNFKLSDGFKIKPFGILLSQFFFINENTL